MGPWSSQALMHWQQLYTHLWLFYPFIPSFQLFIALTCLYWDIHLKSYITSQCKPLALPHILPVVEETGKKKAQRLEMTIRKRLKFPSIICWDTVKPVERIPLESKTKQNIFVSSNSLCKSPFMSQRLRHRPVSVFSAFTWQVNQNLSSSSSLSYK